jgi:hypothetical protein
MGFQNKIHRVASIVALIILLIFGNVDADSLQVVENLFSGKLVPRHYPKNQK